jgi:hypothetical protein
MNKTDHTSGTKQGYFMSPQLVKSNGGNSATLISVTTADLSKKCVAFYYNMFSSTDNYLYVYLTQNQTSSLIWSANTNEGNKVKIIQKILKNS